MSLQKLHALNIYMKSISDITDYGVHFHIEFYKYISNCPLKLQKN